MENAREDAFQYGETVFVPEMGVHPLDNMEEKSEPLSFDVDGEVKNFLKDEKLKVLLV